jgi:NAD(P) transhydrogenase subunit beta
MIGVIAQCIIAVSGFAAAFLLMYGLKRMSSPATAASGIRVAGAGMLGAVVGAYFYAFDVDAAAKPHLLVNLGLAIVAMGIGGFIAGRVGKTVKITAMPQMVAIFNSMGGGAAGSIAAVELVGHRANGLTQLVVTLLGALIGSISFSGSIIAWAKLDEVLKRPLQFRGQQVLNVAIVLATVAFGALTVVALTGGPALLPISTLILSFFGCAMLFGIMLTLPIGGADMPVVMSIFNASTGVAVGLEGYVLGNPALMISGMVVGAAGSLLTILMAQAMNRSILNVLFKKFTVEAAGKPGAIVGEEKPAQASDAAIDMRYAKSVIIVPGYGLAVSQGQQKLYDFVKLLVAAGVSVKFAIHPVAGRMPGQMDVLLAEAGVPYDMIFQLADINDQFATTDVALVIGANDVVNPAARTDKSSPIYGMPILNADKAKKCYVVKRTAGGKGYSGVVNTLFYLPDTRMIYGDAAAVCGEMVEAVKSLGAAAA